MNYYGVGQIARSRTDERTAEEREASRVWRKEMIEKQIRLSNISVEAKRAGKRAA